MKNLAKGLTTPPTASDQCITPDSLWVYAIDKTQSNDAMNWDVSPLKPEWNPNEDFDCFRDRYPAILNRMNPPWSIGRIAPPKAVLELLRGSSTVMLIPHSSAFSHFGQTVLAAVAYKHAMGPVCYKPHNKPNPIHSWMVFVLTPQYLQYMRNKEKRIGGSKVRGAPQPARMQVKTRESELQDNIMLNLLYQGANRDQAARLAGSVVDRA